MKHYQGYLIDLDGTVYNGDNKIQEAIDFINKLKDLNIPYLFLTNNSSRTRERVAEKLTGLGIPAVKDDVFTSSIATANYIAENFPESKLLVVGEEGLLQALHDKGLCITLEEPDIVVMGIDRQITYDKLAKLCLAINEGAKFISTNPDTIVPTDRGMLPGNGSLTSVITICTGVQPTFIGKPEPIIVDQALKLLGTNKDETLIIGDNYTTDIMSGIRSGIDTLLVHTGVTTKQKLKEYEVLPTYSIESLEHWELYYDEKILLK